MIINPGTGPLDGATLADATRNMVAFAAEVGALTGHATLTSYDSACGDGRYRFRLLVGSVQHGATAHVVDMPGLPLGQVRYVDMPDQRALTFPRLYVDGSSWWWMFAVEMCGADE